MNFYEFFSTSVQTTSFNIKHMNLGHNFAAISSQNCGSLAIKHFCSATKFIGASLGIRLTVCIVIFLWSCLGSSVASVYYLIRCYLIKRLRNYDPWSTSFSGSRSLHSQRLLRICSFAPFIVIWITICQSNDVSRNSCRFSFDLAFNTMWRSSGTTYI